MDRATLTERMKEAHAARRVWLASQGPVPAVGRFPYPHRTIAEVDGGLPASARCPKCNAVRKRACSYSRCPLA